MEGLYTISVNLNKQKMSLFQRNKNQKVLDSSVLVDGRILGILNTGFLEGEITVPEFIIKELHALSDSKDHNKRRKGQRGLETLANIQKIFKVNISDKKVDDAQEVDTKLILFCKEEKAKILSLDNNLNKIAKIHNVPVLNINELFSAIRPIVIYGQKISLKVIRRGEQEGQGIGTLEDGTMVIIDGGDEYIGRKIQVIVRQVLSTDSGRLVFAKINLEKMDPDEKTSK